MSMCYPLLRGASCLLMGGAAQRSAGLHVPALKLMRDSLIAATALVHGMTVVTRNVADFEADGVMNPWAWGR